MPVFSQERNGHVFRNGHVPVPVAETLEPVEVFAVSEHAFEPESEV